MKLYATTTSERASKGQGGNDRLYIDVNIGELKEVIKIRINKSPSTESYIATVIMDGKEISQQYYHCYEEEKGKCNQVPCWCGNRNKGKKQKTAQACGYSGEDFPCNVCPKNGRGECTTP